jgi:crotonobetainyl-CoA:carnitine CoA-transferase CaiB-like acyl-CoA transferase
MWWKWRDLNDLANLGHEWTDYGDLGPRYAMYRTADGGAILVCPLERKFWAAFAELLNLPEQVREHGTWNEENGGMDYGYPGEYELIREVIAGKPRSYWVEALQELTIPFAPVLGLAEALTSEHASANDVMRATSLDGTALRVVSSPVQRHVGPDGTVACELPALDPAPRIGEQSAQILAGIGLNLEPDDIA